VFTWGWGLYGQLGHGMFVNEMSPRILNSKLLKGKAMQVQAGWKCSLILMENKKVYWWGTNGTLTKINIPNEFNFEKKVKAIDFLINLSLFFFKEFSFKL
jgi:myosin V